jgi:hypothetical protein
MIITGVAATSYQILSQGSHVRFTAFIIQLQHSVPVRTVVLQIASYNDVSLRADLPLTDEARSVHLNPSRLITTTTPNCDHPHYILIQSSFS